MKLQHLLIDGSYVIIWVMVSFALKSQMADRFSLKEFVPVSACGSQIVLLILCEVWYGCTSML
jgi:hypothetical protein